MKKHVCITAILMLIASASAIADGGGGIELITNAGSDAVTTLAETMSGDVWLDVPTASLVGFGGYGYGVSRSNFKIGGFGFGFLGSEISKPIPYFDVEIVRLAGGFGGVILGSQFAFRPFVVAFNNRIGVGGIAVTQTSYPRETTSRIYTIGTFALYGNAEIEAGLALNRNMLLSAHAGLAGILVFTFLNDPILPLLVPEFGVRIAWGDFW